MGCAHVPLAVVVVAGEERTAEEVDVIESQISVAMCLSRGRHERFLRSPREQCAAYCGLCMGQGTRGMLDVCSGILPVPIAIRALSNRANPAGAQMAEDCFTPDRRAPRSANNNVYI